LPTKKRKQYGNKQQENRPIFMINKRGCRRWKN